MNDSLREITILDTSIIVSNPEYIDTLSNTQVVILLEVVSQLDKLSKETRTARAAHKALKAISEFKVQNGVTVAILPECQSETSLAILEDPVDNKILALARKYQQESTMPVGIATDDTALTIAANSLGIQTKQLPPFEYPSAIATVEIGWGDEEKLVTGQALPLKDSVYPNQQVLPIFPDGSQVKGVLVTSSNNGDYLIPLQPKNLNFRKIKPLDQDQYQYAHFLKSPEHPLVVGYGTFGTGKTTLAIAAAMEAIDNKIIDKIVAIPTLTNTWKEIGFYKGGPQEKIDPWKAPFRQKLFDFLSNSETNCPEQKIWDQVEHYEERFIQYCLPQHLASIEFKNCFVICDESQNFDFDTLYYVWQRCSNGCKMIATGDPIQIFEKGVHPSNSGLVQFISLFLPRIVPVCQLRTNHRGIGRNHTSEINRIFQSYKSF